MSKESTATPKEFRISRTFDAPKDAIYRAWTEPDQLGQWMSPNGMETVSTKMDLRPGGTYHYGLRGPNNMEMWGKWTFREISPDRLVFVVSFSDAEGGMTRHPMSPTWPRETLSTVELKETDGKTSANLSWVPVNATQEERDTFDGAHEGMKQGWSGTMDQLEAYLAKSRN